MTQDKTTVRDQNEQWEAIGRGMYRGMGGDHFMQDMYDSESEPYTFDQFAYEDHGWITNEDDLDMTSDRFRKMIDGALEANAEYLWSRADDPALVEAVTRTVWAGDYELADGDLKRSLRVSTSVEIVATLAHLIGPRPSREDNADER